MNAAYILIGLMTLLSVVWLSVDRMVRQHTVVRDAKIDTLLREMHPNVGPSFVAKIASARISEDEQLNRLLEPIELSPPTPDGLFELPPG